MFFREFIDLEQIQKMEVEYVMYLIQSPCDPGYYPFLLQNPHLRERKQIGADYIRPKQEFKNDKHRAARHKFTILHFGCIITMEFTLV